MRTLAKELPEPIQYAERYEATNGNGAYLIELETPFECRQLLTPLRGMYDGSEDPNMQRRLRKIDAHLKEACDIEDAELHSFYISVKETRYLEKVFTGRERIKRDLAAAKHIAALHLLGLLDGEIGQTYRSHISYETADTSDPQCKVCPIAGRIALRYR